MTQKIMSKVKKSGFMMLVTKTKKMAFAMGFAISVIDTLKKQY